MCFRVDKLAALVALGLIVGCGDDDAAVNDVDPVTFSGGGVGSGAILGELNVTVLEYDSAGPIAGAQVLVGEPEDQSPLTGSTDDFGVATITDSALAGAQTVTVVADGYAPVTWFGVNGANMTVELRLVIEPDAPTAQVSGTIAGWDTMPDPEPGHFRVAVVTYSRTDDFELPENNLEQPNGTDGRPINVCVYMPPNVTAPCAWRLVTRTGPQALFAYILDVDSMGTPDREDDVTTVITYVVQPGFDLAENDVVTDVALDMLDVSDLVDVTVSLPAAPTGLADVQVFPHIVLGDEGRIPLALPALTPDTPTGALPLLVGELAGASYELRAVALPQDGSEDLSAVVFHRTLEIGGTIALDDWLPTTTDVSAVDGVYSFSPVAGASLYSAKLEDAAGNPIWNVLLLDGRTSFSLPELSMDPFPTADATLLVNAMVFPEFDPTDFVTDTLRDSITLSSSASIVFTP